MISYLDAQVGQLVDLLKELGLYEDTLVLFGSDNGPTYNGGTEHLAADGLPMYSREMGPAAASVVSGTCLGQLYGSAGASPSRTPLFREPTGQHASCCLGG